MSDAHEAALKALHDAEAALKAAEVAEATPAAETPPAATASVGIHLGPTDVKKD